MATNLFTPILNARTRSPNFFNGRLLSGEAMTDEQRAQRVAHELLGKAIGDGVVYGYEVEKKSGGEVIRPSLMVKSGVAINRCGEALSLANDIELQLVLPAHTSSAPATLFETCVPPQNGTYVADDGIYLLTVASVGVGQGLASVSGLGDYPRGCNIKYRVDGVEFRLMELPVAPSIRADIARLRNRVAYLCFGVDDLLDFATDPFAGDAEPRTLLDEIRGTDKLSDCDVPLAVMHWNATQGIQFLDLWSVRRRITHTRASTTHPALSDRRMATAEAMVLQFEEHIDAIPLDFTTAAIQARTRFRYLPPVGLLPLTRPGDRGFSDTAFFTGIPHRGPEYIHGAALSSLVLDAVEQVPVDTEANEFVWLYRTWQNQLNIPSGRKSYLIFASPHTRYRASARFDLSRWDYSNYSDCCSEVTSE